MNRLELAYCMSQNTDLDFVAYVITPFHLSGVKAYLDYYHDQLMRNLKGIILIGKHDRSGYLLSEDIMLAPYLDAKVFQFEMEGELPKWDCTGKKKDLMLICPETPWLALDIFCKKSSNYRVTNIIVDDGTGSYLSLFERAQFFANEVNSRSKAVVFYLKRVALRVVSFAIGIKTEKFSIFDRKHFMENTSLKYYKKAIEAGLEKSEFDLVGKSVVYLGTAYPSDAEKQRRESLVFNYLKRYYEDGYKIYIKAHPRDNMASANIPFPVEILPRNNSIEEIICGSSVKPEIVMGWNSSALITLSAIWGVYCLSLSGIIPEDMKNIGIRQTTKMIKSNPKSFKTLKFVCEIEQEKNFG